MREPNYAMCNHGNIINPVTKRETDIIKNCHFAVIRILLIYVNVNNVRNET